MPYPNEHSARLRDPDDFDADSFRRTHGGTIYGSKEVPETIDIIWGKLKGAAEEDDPVIPQALRFPTKDWTAEEAKAWLADNEIDYISFEEATGDEDEKSLAIKQIRHHILNDTHHRNFTLSRDAIDKEKRTVELSFSSEAPVVRWWGIEILDHSPEAIRMDRWTHGPAFLMDHNPDDQRGIIEQGVLGADKILRGTARVSRHPRGEELWMDLLDGIRRYTSIGYAIHRFVELTPEEMSDEVKSIALKEKLPVYRATEWEPLEGSSVSIPADTRVGLGRSWNSYTKKPENSSKPPTPVPAASGANVGGGQQTITINRGAPKMPEPTQVTPAPANPEELVRKERERISEIGAIAKRFVGRVEKIDEMERDAVKNGLSVELFKGQIADRLASDPKIFTPDSDLGLTEKETKKYSLLRAIQALIPNSGIEAPFERECSNEIAKRTGQKPGGFFVPMDIQTRRLDPINKRAISTRDLLVSEALYGSKLVGTEHQGASMIELLRNKPLAAQLGVQVLTGLVGDIAFPKQTGSGSFYWVGEGGEPTESQLSVGQVKLSPKEGAAYQEYSRTLLLQASPSIETLVQDDLVAIASLGVDKAVFHGSNSNFQPKGIVNEVGVGSVDGAGIGWEGIVDFETKVAVSNADVNAMYYAMNPTLRGILKTRLKAMNTAVFLMGEDGMVNGYRSAVSNQITSGYIFFGDFRQEMLAYWGLMDVLVNPFSKDITGMVRVSIRLDVDCGARQPVAFSVSTNVT